MKLDDVPEHKLERVEAFVSVLEGGALADALMSVCLGYRQRGVKLDHLKEKLARTLESKQAETP